MSRASIYLFAAAVSFLLTPVVRMIAIRTGAMDIPKDQRRMHKKPIPRLGGLAIYISIILSTIIFVEPLTMEIQAMLLGASVIVVSGLLDDTKGLTPTLKVIFQVIAAAIVMFGGIKVSYISNFLGERGSVINIGLLSYPVSLLWIVGVTNAINLIDGLDGLADGVSAIASLCLAVISFMFGNQEIGVLCLILSGACSGFLPFNFNPAKIFMGDTGALLLGFMFSVITIEGVLKTAAAVAVAIPVLLLAVPISDTFFAIIRRSLSGKSITTADKGHLHHRIIALGYNHRETVLILYLMTLFFGVAAIVVSVIGGVLGNLLAIFLIVLMIIGAKRIGMFKSA